MSQTAPSEMLQRVLDHVDATLDTSLERLFSFLKIPSISTDPAYRAECRAAASWLAADLATIGVDVEIAETGGHPVVLGKRKGSSGKTLLFYGHYDVQPVDPLDLWTSPPFEPRLVTREDGRRLIMARGACDDKGQLMTFVEACRAFAAVTGTLPADIVFCVEGEEESGSVNLPAFIVANQDRLQADLALVCDTSMWDPATPAITSSLRGLVYEECVIRCADRDLHSGLYGGAARNPIHVLSKVIAALHDENGKVLVPGFYDGVEEPPDDILERWKGLDLTAANFLGPIGLSIPAGETGRLVIEQIQSRPTCDVNGIVGGYTGAGAKTVIPSDARAKISFRLVGVQDPERIRAAFRTYVQSMTPKDCRVEFINHSGAKPIHVPLDKPELSVARAALQEEWSVPPVVIGSGGSIPVVGDFKRSLGIDSLLIGFGLDDDRVHSPNEKYDLTSFHKGIRSWVRVLAALSAAS